MRVIIMRSTAHRILAVRLARGYGVEARDEEGRMERRGGEEGRGREGQESRTREKEKHKSDREEKKEEEEEEEDTRS